MLVGELLRQPVEGTLHNSDALHYVADTAQLDFEPLQPHPIIGLAGCHIARLTIALTSKATHLHSL